MTCPDGTVIAYDAEGRPDPANPSAFDRRLDAYPVIRSWDGQLLLGVAVPVIMRPQWMAVGTPSTSAVPPPSP